MKKLPLKQKNSWNTKQVEQEINQLQRQLDALETASSRSYTIDQKKMLRRHYTAQLNQRRERLTALNNSRNINSLAK